MAAGSEISFLYGLARQLARAIARLVARIEVSGADRFPRTGPLIVASNHLHALDIPLVALVVPRRPLVLAAEKWRGTPGARIMEIFCRVIYVARGEPDRRALDEALTALRAGAALAVAPEGTRSRSGGLLSGKDGCAYLAGRAGAPIVPVAIWGQETAMAAWRGLRRPHVHVRIGKPIHLPPDARLAHGAELRAYTDEVMLALAGMLPPAYRGVYAERAGG